MSAPAGAADPEESARALREFVAARHSETAWADAAHRQAAYVDALDDADDELLRWLAKRYATHPRYRQEWRP